VGSRGRIASQSIGPDSQAAGACSLTGGTTPRVERFANDRPRSLRSSGNCASRRTVDSTSCCVELPLLVRNQKIVTFVRQRVGNLGMSKWMTIAFVLCALVLAGCYEGTKESKSGSQSEGNSQARSGGNGQVSSNASGSANPGARTGTGAASGTADNGTSNGPSAGVGTARSGAANSGNTAATEGQSTTTSGTESNANSAAQSQTEARATASGDAEKAGAGSNASAPTNPSSSASAPSNPGSSASAPTNPGSNAAPAPVPGGTASNEPASPPSQGAGAASGTTAVAPRPATTPSNKEPARTATPQNTATPQQEQSSSPVQLSRPQIRELQRALARQGFDTGSADGILGARTRQAIRAFQSKRGMQVTGDLDRITLGALGLTVSGELREGPGYASSRPPESKR
jgi:hypothetical protein